MAGWAEYVETLRGVMARTTRAVQLAVVGSLASVCQGVATPAVVGAALADAHLILAPALDAANHSALRSRGLHVLIVLLKKLPLLGPG